MIVVKFIVTTNIVRNFKGMFGLAWQALGSCTPKKLWKWTQELKELKVLFFKLALNPKISTQNMAFDKTN